jgi:hypothetical protein
MLVCVACHRDQPPQQPARPVGQSFGPLDTTYNFEVATGDSDGDAVSYRLDWGDDTWSEWSVLMPADSPTVETHRWGTDGLYKIRVQAKDEHGAMSEWSGPAYILVGHAPDFTLTDLSGANVRLYSILPEGPVLIVWWNMQYLNPVFLLNDLQPAYDSLEPFGFDLLALSINEATDESEVRSFVANRGWRNPVLLDPSQGSRLLYGPYPICILVSMDTAVVYERTIYHPKSGEADSIKAEILKWMPRPDRAR